MIICNKNLYTDNRGKDMKFQDHINKGNECTKKGYYELAIVQYHVALSILQTSDYVGFCDKETALVHANLANAYKNDGCPQEAIIHYNKALKIYLELITNNVDNDDIATTCYDLADTYAICKNHENAITYYNYALSIWQNIYGKESSHQDITNCHKQIKFCQECNAQTLESMEAPDDNNGRCHDDSAMLIGGHPKWPVINIFDG